MGLVKGLGGFLVGSAVLGDGIRALGYHRIGRTKAAKVMGAATVVEAATGLALRQHPVLSVVCVLTQSVFANKTAVALEAKAEGVSVEAMEATIGLAAADYLEGRFVRKAPQAPIVESEPELVS